MTATNDIEINLDSIESGLRLYIDARRQNSLFDAEVNASKNNEARYQLIEGCYYDYTFNNSNYKFGNVDGQIVQSHKRNLHTGTISPNIFVGTLSLPIIKIGIEGSEFKVELEVQSIKSGYRDDYRDMLELITGKCTDLLLQANSPVSHKFEIDYTKDSQTLYQRFAFINSVIGTDEFAESIHRIVTSPVTKWVEILEGRDIRQVKRFTNTNVKDLLKGGNRAKIPNAHYLRDFGIKSLPERIITVRKTDSVDTSENRFVKHALETFWKFCTEINKYAKIGSKLANESLILILELEMQLNHAVFKDISRPTTLTLNSPVLQRKEGYREVLRAWLMFDLAAKLIWTGGDDIYSGGKKDIATLYEYWLFFKLLDLFKNIFKIDPKDISDLIKETPDGLNLQIKQGKFTALRGVFISGSRKLNIRYNYNRTFSGRKDYPDSGSWTTTLRPDYTLSFWPLGISEPEAEKQELIVHIHFDAKYKIGNLSEFLEQKSKDALDEEKTENRKGIYKNADLLKMHAYKDAIRRTGGAYILYPGDKSLNRKGFHEIIPGLGAFPVSPSKTDSGISDLKSFILEIIEHFINRSSQREKQALRTFDIYKNAPPPNNEIKDAIPEAYNNNRSLIPEDTYVLVGYCKSDDHLEWINKKLLYNFRMNNSQGALKINQETLNAKYLLLHMERDQSSSRFYKIKKPEYRVTDKETLIRLNYPDPKQKSYLVVKLEPCLDIEFENVSWNFKQLKNHRLGRASAIPFTASLPELMKNISD